MPDVLANGVIVPKPTEPISASGVAEMRTLGQSVDTALGQVPDPWARGMLPDGTDLNALNSQGDSGLYGISSSRPYVNLPFAGKHGVLEVKVSASTGGYQEVTQYATGARWRREMTNYYSSPRTWGPWKRLDVDVLSRGLLADGADLDEMSGQTDSGIWGLGSSSTYVNSPLLADTSGQLRVSISASVGGYQEVSQYASTRIWRREMTNYFTSPRSWGDWYRIDIDHEALDETLALAGRQFYLQGTLPDGADLNTLNGLQVQGIYTLGTTSAYVNIPRRPSPTWRGMLINWSTGNGDVWQRVQWSHQEGVWERQQRTSGVWTEWVRTDAQWDDLRVERIEGRVELLEATAPTRTMWEQAELVSSYGAGEAYLDRLYRDHMDPRGLRYPEQYHDNVRLLDLGPSFENRPIRAIEMGDPAKPAFLIMAAQHGDEISGREAALIWAREVAESTDPEVIAALDAICLLIVPTVNADRINIRRQNAQNVNLNRDWGADPAYPEVQAVTTLFDSHDIVAVIDAHEGGSVTDAQVNYARLTEIHPDVRAASQRMYNAAWAGIEGAGLPVSEYPDSGEIEWAVGGIPVRHHAATLLQENPTNSINPYHPPLQGRIDQYRASYTALFLDVAQNVQVYVDAKAASMGA